MDPFSAGVAIFAAGLVARARCGAIKTEKTSRRALSKLTYPKTRRTPTVDRYHGAVVADPYRWLEDPDSEETKEWVEAQNNVTNEFLDTCDTRNFIREKLTQNFNYPRFSCPFKRGDKYFFFKNNGLQNQSVLHKQDSLDAKETVLLDPNLLSEDGTVSLGTWEFSEDGAYLAYGVSSAGSDWNTIHVRRVSDGVDLKDVVDRVKFSSISWTHDGKGFFYSAYPTLDHTKAGDKKTKLNEKHTVYYHVLGTKQEEDYELYSTPEDPKWLLNASVTDDGKYILIRISPSCDPVNRLYYLTIEDFNSALRARTPPKVVKLIDNFDAEYDYIGNEGSVFWFKTNLNAAKYKIVKIDLADPDPTKWTDVIPEKENVLKYAVVVSRNKFIVCYSVDVKDKLQLYDSEGRLLRSEFEFPSIGAVSGLAARSQDSEFFYSFSSFLYPGVTYRVDLSKDESKVFRETRLKDFDPTLYRADQIFYESKDGTRIPMFIVRSKDMALDGNNPTFLYGYGGFNVSLDPGFSVTRLNFIRHFGGIVAIPNLRGGGEYGEEWHKEGTILKKQNVFDDFIAAAEWLIANKYTQPKLLAINGGSNGGLLVAACANQRPDLFGCVVSAVGVLDMLRFHKFTIGYAWVSDYGSSDNKEQFEALYKYSPLHNIPDGKPYPAMLVTTADHDDRVVPSHSFKFISQLQYQLGEKSFQHAPLLIRIECKAGHGGGKPLTKTIDEWADTFGFIAKTLKLTFRP